MVDEVPRRVIVSVPADSASCDEAIFGALVAVMALPVVGPTVGAFAMVTAEAAPHPVPAGELALIAPCAPVVLTWALVSVTVRADLTLVATAPVVVRATVMTL